MLARATSRVTRLLAARRAEAALAYLHSVEDANKCYVDLGFHSANVAAYRLTLLQLQAQNLTGRCGACARDYLVLDNPYPGNMQSAMVDSNTTIDETALGEQIRAAGKRCVARYERALRRFHKTACQIPRVAGLALPSSALPPGATRGCVSMSPAKQKTGGGWICPRLAVHAQTAAGVSATPLRPPPPVNGISSSPLTDPSRCCAAELAGVTRYKGKNLVRFTGASRDCFGGTAAFSVDATYELSGSHLREYVDHSAYVH